MVPGVFRRFKEWAQSGLRREGVPEFRTREEYFRWKAAQQSELTCEHADDSADASAKRPEKVVQGPPVCPYCGESFPTFPKRKRKCPSCGNVVVIWRGRDRKQRVLVTEARARALAAEEEQERARIAAEVAADPEYRFRRVARMVDGLRISDDEIRDQLSVSASEGDAAWALFNRRLTRCMAENDFELLSFTYFRMALQLDAEGRDFRELLRAADRTKLLAIQQQAREWPDLFSGVSILSGRGCEACAKIDGKRFTLEEAIRLQPLPCSDCTSTLKSGRPGWCTCIYLEDFQRE